MKKSLILLLLAVSTAAMAQAGLELNRYEEYRYCGTPKRDADGSIHRDARPLIAFQSHHPCPSTGLRQGSCPGWAIDHVIPLACGGCDSVLNLQWLPNSWKSTSDPLAKDRFERKIYGAEPAFADTGNCRYPVKPAQ